MKKHMWLLMIIVVLLSFCAACGDSDDSSGKEKAEPTHSEAVVTPTEKAVITTMEEVSITPIAELTEEVKAPTNTVTPNIPTLTFSPTVTPVEKTVPIPSELEGLFTESSNYANLITGYWQGFHFTFVKQVWYCFGNDNRGFLGEIKGDSQFYSEADYDKLLKEGAKWLEDFSYFIGNTRYGDTILIIWFDGESGEVDPEGRKEYYILNEEAEGKYSGIKQDGSAYSTTTDEYQKIEKEYLIKYEDELKGYSFSGLFYIRDGYMFIDQEETRLFRSVNRQLAVQDEIAPYGSWVSCYGRNISLYEDNFGIIKDPERENASGFDFQWERNDIGEFGQVFILTEYLPEMERGTRLLYKGDILYEVSEEGYIQKAYFKIEY